ncbi:MAG: hypothetical protein LBS77_00090 [Desulfovibrio sp.]|jgi:hypothetical protein|nr:hypothetical protein [Desulfovibrio sp.]
MDRASFDVLRQRGVQPHLVFQGLKEGMQRMALRDVASGALVLLHHDSIDKPMLGTSSGNSRCTGYHKVKTAMADSNMYLARYDGAIRPQLP